MYREIERLLSEDNKFNIKQTLGYPFKVFKITGVGSIMEELIAKTATFNPRYINNLDKYRCLNNKFIINSCILFI